MLGLDPARIAEILERSTIRERPHSVPPLWDGHAGGRAATEVEGFFDESVLPAYVAIDQPGRDVRAAARPPG